MHLGPTPLALCLQMLCSEGESLSEIHCFALKAAKSGISAGTADARNFANSHSCRKNLEMFCVESMVCWGLGGS